MSSLSGYSSQSKSLSGLTSISADSLSVAGIVTADNLSVSGDITQSSGTSNLQSINVGDISLISGEISGVTNIFCSGNVSGTVVTSSQPNITSLGKLQTLDVSNNITLSSGVLTVPQISCSGNVSGTVVTSSQPNITSLGKLQTLDVSNNITLSSGVLTVPQISCSGNVSGTVVTSSQPNITSLGKLQTLDVSNNITLSSGVLTVPQISCSGDFTHGAINTKPNYKGGQVKSGCNTIGTEETNSIILDGTYTGDTTQFTFTTSSVGVSVGYAYKAFGASLGEYYSAGGYSATTGASTSGTTVNDINGTAWAGHWVQVQLKTYTIQPTSMSVTFPKLSGNAASKTLKKTFYFEVEGGGTAVAISANVTISQYLDLTVRKNDFGIFGRTVWEGLKAPRTGVYQVNFSCRFDDGDFLRAVVPRIVGVRDLGPYWVSTDGLSNARRCHTFSTCIYLTAGQVFNFRTGYACTVQWWYFNGFYVTDTY